MVVTGVNECAKYVNVGEGFVWFTGFTGRVSGLRRGLRRARRGDEGEADSRIWP